MFEKALLLLLISALLEYSECACQKASTRPVKTYKIDLDKPARERFIQPASDFKNEIAALIEYEKKTLKFPPAVVEVFELVTSKLDDYFPYPFNEEIKGIAKVTDMSVGDVLVANLIYDLTAFCTGIIATQANGQIIHGRNLDYGASVFLKNLTYKAEFYRNGTLLFTTAQLAGYIGILTGHKHNAFTFSINERDQGDWWMNLIFGLLDKKSTPLSFLSRKVLENATSFDEAVKTLATATLIAPAYFIVGGVKTNEGAVITRNQLEAIDIWRLNASSSGIEKWYLLETNYDHWVPPPANDDRRTPGMKAMNAITQANINYSTLLDVLTIHPVCNPTTVYSVVMSAAEQGENALEITIR